jgi:hypothetical protein
MAQEPAPALANPVAPAVPPAPVEPAAAQAASIFTPIQVTIRRYMFYGVFVVLALLYVAIVVLFETGHEPISGYFMRQIVLTAPFILPEIPLIGELVPAVLGGIIAATAPAKASNRQLLIVLAASCVVYFLYLNMSVFLGMNGDNPNTEGLREELAAQGIDDIGNAIKVLESFSSSVRNFAAFVFAALIGIKFNDAQTIGNPMLRRRSDKPVAAPAQPAGGNAVAPQANVVVPQGNVVVPQGNENPPPADDANDNPAPAPNAPNG